MLATVLLVIFAVAPTPTLTSETDTLPRDTPTQRPAQRSTLLVPTQLNEGFDEPPETVTPSYAAPTIPPATQIERPLYDSRLPDITLFVKVTYFEYPEIPPMKCRCPDHPSLTTPLFVQPVTVAFASDLPLISPTIPPAVACLAAFPSAPVPEISITALYLAS